MTRARVPVSDFHSHFPAYRGFPVVPAVAVIPEEEAEVQAGLQRRCNNIPAMVGAIAAELTRIRSI